MCRSPLDTSNRTSVRAKTFWRLELMTVPRKDRPVAAKKEGHSTRSDEASLSDSLVEVD